MTKLAICGLRLLAPCVVVLVRLGYREGILPSCCGLCGCCFWPGEKYEPVAALEVLPRRALALGDVGDCGGGGGEVERRAEAKSSRVVDSVQSMTAHSRPKVFVAI